MPLELLYWILMLFWLLVGLYWGASYPAGPGRYGFAGWSILLFLLFLVIGLKLFGAPIRG